MNVFRAASAAFMGEDVARPPSEIPPVDRIAARLGGDTLRLEDRREAVAQLKVVSQERPHEVAAKALPALVGILKTLEDVEMARTALEVLVDALSRPPPGPDGRPAPKEAEEQTLAYTQEFVQGDGNVDLLLSLLHQDDFYLRYHTIQLLTVLLSNKASMLQTKILQAPHGIGWLVDLLADQRDIICNEGLVLVTALVKSNPDIQKIVVFEGAFEKLLAIVDKEGGADGDIIVQDCLVLIGNLLRGQPSSQLLFREGGCIQQMQPLLSPPVERPVDDRAAAVLMLALDVIQMLAGGHDSATAGNKDAIVKSGVFSAVLSLAQRDPLPPLLRAVALRTLASVVSGKATAAAKHLTDVPSPDALPPLLVLVQRVLRSGTDADDRLALLALFDGYVSDAPDRQLTLVSTVTPPPHNVERPSAGDALGATFVAAMLDWAGEADQLRSWCAAALLGHAIRDNEQARQLLLRVPLEVAEAGVKPKQLMPALCLSLLTWHSLAGKQGMDASMSGAHTHVAIGHLRILITWLNTSPGAVAAFLTEANDLIPALVGMVMDTSGNLHVAGIAAALLGVCIAYNDETSGTAFTRSYLYELLRTRVGIDRFRDALERVRKSNAFLYPGESEAPLYEEGFGIEFRSVTDALNVAFLGSGGLATGVVTLSGSASAPSPALTTSNGVAVTADAAPASAAAATGGSGGGGGVDPAILAERDREITQLKDKLAAAEARAAAAETSSKQTQDAGVAEAVAMATNRAEAAERDAEAARAQLSQYQAEVVTLQQHVMVRDEAVAQRDKLIVELREASQTDTVSELVAQYEAELKNLTVSHGQLDELCNQQRQQIAELEGKLAAASTAGGGAGAADASVQHLTQANATLQKRLDELAASKEAEIEELRADMMSATVKATAAARERDEALAKLAAGSADGGDEAAELRKQLDETKAELDAKTTELDDLFVVLNDLDEEKTALEQQLEAAQAKSAS